MIMYGEHKNLAMNIDGNHEGHDMVKICVFCVTINFLEKATQVNKLQPAPIIIN